MKKGRTAALLGLAGALAILAAVGAMTWRPVLARWFLAELESADPERRISAAGWLVALRSERAVPFLVDAVRRERIPEDVATSALSGIGQAAVPGIIEALRDGNLRVRRAATESLLALEPEKYLEIGEDLRRLAGVDEEHSAISALAGRFPPSEVALAALIGYVRENSSRWGCLAIEALGNGDGYFPQERHEAADLLAEMGPAAWGALPALRRALWDTEPEFRARVALALWKIDGDAVLEEAVVAMIEAMADRHWDFMGSQAPRCRIIGDCLARIGARAMPLILPRLDDEDEYIRLGLIRALEKLGPAAASARPALEARLGDPHFRVRAAAARALKAIAP